jgi:pectate lyase
MVSRKVPLSLLAAATATVTATAVLPGLLLSPASAAVKAFPGAEGFGTDTPGGRGGTVCKVVNLNDSGPGSLRSCVEATGPRYVVFEVGGTISLNNRITASSPFLTIAGQTAPGDGITLRMNPDAGTDAGTLQIATHDVVVRYLRFRPGNGGAADDSNDAITIYKGGVRNVVVDHSSFSWAVDENVNTYDGSTDITVSNSIIAEGLSNAGHPDGEHSKGMLSGGVDAHNVSIHHNLFVSNVDRNPQVSGVSVADVRNNVVYNYGDGSGSGVTLISSSKGEPRVNWVGNYYKPGPNSDPNRAEFATYNGSTGASHQWYGEGNMRWTPGGDQDARIAESVGRVTTPFAAAPVTTTSAAAAYERVLADAGASRVRDAVDQRLVEEVRTGTGSITDATGAYPVLAAGTAPTDSDGDGMPNAWESANGTNPSAPDATGDVNGNGYDNIEDWFNSLAPGAVSIGVPPAAGPPAAAAADVTGPKVMKARPEREAKRVERDANVTVKWSEKLRRSSVDKRSVWLKKKGSSEMVRATLTYLPAKHRVRLDPKRNLTKRSTYRVVVKSTIKDMAGNRFDAKPKAGMQSLRWTFRTR